MTIQNKEKVEGNDAVASKLPQTLTPKPGICIDFESLVITGARICLRPATEEYAADMRREFTTEITRYMIPKPSESREEFQKVLDTFREQRRNGTDLVFAVVERARGEFLGCCGIHGRENPRQPELGLWIKKGAHGNKYGREAIRTLVSWAGENLVVESFTYPVDRNNIPSRKIPEFLGGTIVAEKKVTSMNGKILDEVIYLVPVPGMP